MHLWAIEFGSLVFLTFFMMVDLPYLYALGQLPFFVTPHCYYYHHDRCINFFFGEVGIWGWLVEKRKDTVFIVVIHNCEMQTVIYNNYSL